MKRNEEYTQGEILTAVPFFFSHCDSRIFELIMDMGHVRIPSYRDGGRLIPHWKVWSRRDHDYRDFGMFEQEIFTEDDYCETE